MIFKVPAMKNGALISAGRANRMPAKTGANAAPVVREMPVIPAAADRSCGGTIAMVYDWRVGTSILLILKRRRKTENARDKFGIKGMRINRKLESRSVKTIILKRPKR